MTVLISLGLAACDATWVEVDPPASTPSAPMVESYSYSRPDEVRVRHLALDLAVDFEAQQLRGSVTLDLERAEGAEWLWLDTWDLEIVRVLDSADQAELAWTLGEETSFLGRSLAVALGPETRSVIVEYATGDDARALQWLDGGQTSSGQPFLYTQSQPILARSWVPCQDTPAVRVTYKGTVRLAQEELQGQLLALMSAANPTEKAGDGVFEFDMPQPIPTYLLALAVGDLEFRSVGDCCGVYAEPALAEEAAWEFADTQRMMNIAEDLYGPYRWQRFDMLVLPPSFPYGGMENPRLTFLTPVLVAGDRTLVSTVAHELAHSWSGNLVTNATWEDFWLNEGFTTYFERRIMEEVDGREVVEMHSILGRDELEAEIAGEPAGEELDTALYVPLEGRDPDEVLHSAPYEKGYLFLRLLEETLGRETFDRFLREYFEGQAFKTMTTETFVELLRRDLLGGDEELATQLKIDEWIWQGGLPDNAPEPASSAFEKVEAAAAAFAAGTAASALDVEGWITPQWEQFLASLPVPLEAARLADLDTTFSFSSANGVIRRSWFNVVIDSDYRDGYDELESFLLGIGRTWLLRPLYGRLAKTEEGLAFARDVYARARPGYHSTTRAAIDGILGGS